MQRVVAYPGFWTWTFVSQLAHNADDHDYMWMRGPISNLRTMLMIMTTCAYQQFTFSLKPLCRRFSSPLSCASARKTPSRSRGWSHCYLTRGFVHSQCPSSMATLSLPPQALQLFNYMLTMLPAKDFLSTATPLSSLALEGRVPPYNSASPIGARHQETYRRCTSIVVLHPLKLLFIRTGASSNCCICLHISYLKGARKLRVHCQCATGMPLCRSLTCAAPCGCSLSISYPCAMAFGVPNINNTSNSRRVL